MSEPWSDLFNGNVYLSLNPWFASYTWKPQFLQKTVPVWVESSFLRYQKILSNNMWSAFLNSGGAANWHK